MFEAGGLKELATAVQFRCCHTICQRLTAFHIFRHLTHIHHPFYSAVSSVNEQLLPEDWADRARNTEVYPLSLGGLMRIQKREGVD
jgi:hypothetical protein